MNIEILDAQGAVITKVDNTTDPDTDTTAYGGTSWRTYVEPAEVTLDRNRAAKVRETRAHAMTLIGGLIPALANESTLDLIVELLQAGAFASGFPTAGSDMERVKDIYIYAKGKIAQARAATQAQLDAYDPATDSNWP